jgi:alkylresorcinol/alkylpyrone synthase
VRCTEQFARMSTRSRALLRKVLTSDNGIASRHLALETLTEAFELRPDVLHRRFARHAPDLASVAAARALADAGCPAAQMDALLVSTCTGYLCPGLTSYVSERLGLRTDALTLDLVGQGCGAALPSLRVAEALLAAGRAQRVLCVCVEVCSAAFYLDDDPGVLISACLFGDGAGAAILAARAHPGQRCVEWKSGSCRLAPEQRDALRFDYQDGMLRNILSPEVPAIAARHAARVMDEALENAGVHRDQIKGWILHPGGRDVLLALRGALGLSGHEVRHSAAVLREFGNISSPTVFFVLDEALKDSVPDGIWWMSTFGAGFSCHGALLKVSAG